MSNEIRSQNELLHSQTAALQHEFNAINTLRGQEMEMLKRMLVNLSYNMDRPPQDRLPLEVPSPSPPQPERGR